MILGNKIIDETSRPLVIAELSCNHGGKLEDAIKLVEAAAICGADAVKTQTYTADSLVDKSHSLYATYEKAAMPFDWNEIIFERAKELGMFGFSSVFCDKGLAYLESIDCPVYKIASFENNHLELISNVAATGKPLIISTGMATKREIWDAIDTAMGAGCGGLILTHCNSSYPTHAEDANLNTMRDLASSFYITVGFSDHCTDNSAAILSVAMGAKVIEKHFTLSHDNDTLDKDFSLDPKGLEELCRGVAGAHAVMGTVKYGCKTEQERASSKYRRCGDKMLRGDEARN